jgi:hypothetical protein
VSRFQPVHLPADRRLNGKASQTFLRHMNACPRSGYLYALHKGEAQTADMIRGSAIHEILARATQLAVDRGEASSPARSSRCWWTRCSPRCPSRSSSTTTSASACGGGRPRRRSTRPP